MKVLLLNGSANKNGNTGTSPTAWHQVRQHRTPRECRPCAPDELLKELTRNSYKVVKAKYTKKRYETIILLFIDCGQSFNFCTANN